MTSPPTDKQLKVLKLLMKYTLSNGYPPTLAEMAKTLRRAVPTVWQSVRALKRKGLIKSGEGKTRTITVTPKGSMLCSEETRSVAKAPEITFDSLTAAIKTIPRVGSAPTIVTKKENLSIVDRVLGVVEDDGETVSGLFFSEIIVSELVPERNKNGQLVAWMMGKDREGNDYVRELILE